MDQAAVSTGDGLTRNVGFFGLLLTSEGSIIGSGWLFGALFAATIGGPAAIIAWLIGSVAVILLALVHAEPGGMFPVSGGTTLEVIHTPGHSPGGCCLYDRSAGALFSGDTLFKGGPGATGRSYSDFPTIIESIRDRLLVLPAETRTLTGHGDETTIGDEAPHLPDWLRDRW